MADFVHPGWVRSKTDGDRHWVGAMALIRIYGLNPATTAVVAGPNPDRSGLFLPNDRHFYPRHDGNYTKEQH